MPRRAPAVRLRGKSSAGSRQSRRGSSRPASHSNVEEVILKQLRNESGLRLSGPGPNESGSSSGSGSRGRFWGLREARVAAICWERRKWWTRRELESADLESEELVEDGGKMRRRRRRSWEIREERRAANFRDSMWFSLFFSFLGCGNANRGWS